MPSTYARSPALTGRVAWSALRERLAQLVAVESQDSDRHPHPEAFLHRKASPCRQPPTVRIEVEPGAEGLDNCLGADVQIDVGSQEITPPALALLRGVALVTSRAEVAPG